MKFNGTIFSKPQQDQLKENIGNELEKVSDRMLNYKGEWVDREEYHENDIVTWTDGRLYEVIKAHTSSNTLKPGNTEYYKAMTPYKYTSESFRPLNKNNATVLQNFVSKIASNMNKGRAVNVWVSQLDGLNMNMTPYPPDANSENCILVGMRRLSTKIFEICYLIISADTDGTECKYVIFNPETMEMKKTGDYSGNASITVME